jgi:phosphohistidine phosphatase SixA
LILVCCAPTSPINHWHLLHGIYPGHGNDVEAMKRVAAPLQQLAKAGWEPITQARAEPATVRLERFGNAPELFLVAHNPTREAVTASIAVDLKALAMDGAVVTATLAGRELPVSNGKVSLALAPQATEMLRLRRP